MVPPSKQTNKQKCLGCLEKNRAPDALLGDLSKESSPKDIGRCVIQLLCDLGKSAYLLWVPAVMFNSEDISISGLLPPNFQRELLISETDNIVSSSEKELGRRNEVTCLRIGHEAWGPCHLSQPEPLCQTSSFHLCLIQVETLKLEALMVAECPSGLAVSTLPPQCSG